MVKQIKGSFSRSRNLVARFRAMTKLIFWNADTTTARLILALSSFIFALTLLGHPEGFERTAYDVMRGYANAHTWGALFLLHSFGVLWRFLDTTPRIYAALAVNVFGLTIWLLSTIWINMAIGAFSPGTSVEFVTCFFGAWALFRTGLQEEMVSP